MKLRDLGEDRLIARLVRHFPAADDVVAGPGDDCAVVRLAGARDLLLLKTDCVVEGIHFLPNESPAAIGRKAMARTLSDFAAMSGLPRFALITLLARPQEEVQRVESIYRGLAKMAKRFDVAIVGGETSATRGPLTLTISAVGCVEKDRCIYRRGGEPGDALFVSGKLGGSIRRKHLHFTPRVLEARWLTENFHVHAMMDLSDGLGADLPRLSRASEVGFSLDRAAIPRARGCTTEQAINDGEDYELLFAISAGDTASLGEKWRKRFPRLPLTCIGALQQRAAESAAETKNGFHHFA